MEFAKKSLGSMKPSRSPETHRRAEYIKQRQFAKSYSRSSVTYELAKSSGISIESKESYEVLTREGQYPPSEPSGGEGFAEPDSTDIEEDDLVKLLTGVKSYEKNLEEVRKLTRRIRWTNYAVAPIILALTMALLIMMGKELPVTVKEKSVNWISGLFENELLNIKSFISKLLDPVLVSALYRPDLLKE